MFNGRKLGERGGVLVPVKRSVSTFNEEKKLIPGRIILHILTMKNSCQDLPPSASKVRGSVSIGVGLHHEASGHRMFL